MWSSVSVRVPVGAVSRVGRAEGLRRRVEFTIPDFCQRHRVASAETGLHSKRYRMEEGRGWELPIISGERQIVVAPHSRISFAREPVHPPQFPIRRRFGDQRPST